MKIKNEKEIKKLLEGSEAYIISTENGIGVVGHGAKVLTLYTTMTHHLIETMDEKTIREVFELATKTDKELEKMALEKLKEVFKELAGEKNE